MMGRTAWLCLLIGGSLVGLSSAAAGQRPVPRPVLNKSDSVDVAPVGVDCSKSPSACFRIHYSTDTTDADSPDLTDLAPANGVPDYVDLIGAALQATHQRQIVDLGWPVPPGDGVRGGDSRYDVYVHEVGCGVIAYVQSETAGAVPPGEPSYMGLDQDLRGCYLDPNINSGPGDLGTLSEPEVIWDVVAHEYHHSVQFGISEAATSFGPGDFAEASANWMNDETFDHINANVLSEALGFFTVFREPEVPLASLRYGGWFWLRFLSEKYGHGLVRDAWFRMRNTPNPHLAIDSALAARGSSLRREWVGFTMALLDPEKFEEGASYPDLGGSGGFADSITTFPQTPSARSTAPLTRRYVYFSGPDAGTGTVLQARLQGSDPNRFSVSALALHKDGTRSGFFAQPHGDTIQELYVSAHNENFPGLSEKERVLGVVAAVADTAALAGSASSFRYCVGDCESIGGPDPALLFGRVHSGYQQPYPSPIPVLVDRDGDCSPDANSVGCNEPGDLGPGKATVFLLVFNLGAGDVTGNRIQVRVAPASSPHLFGGTFLSQPFNLTQPGSPTGRRFIAVPVTFPAPDSVGWCLDAALERPPFDGVSQDVNLWNNRMYIALGRGGDVRSVGTTQASCRD